MTLPSSLRTLRTPWKLLLSLALLVGAAAGSGGCASDQQVIGQAKNFHSTLEPAVVEPNDDPVLAEYIQKVGNRVIEAARQLHGEAGDADAWMFSDKMQFHFVNSKTINAFTTGGEHMYIYTQLFLESKSEDELAAVVAHEYAHVYGRHVHKGMNRQLALLGAAAAAGAAGYAYGGDDKGGEYAGIAGGAALLAGQFIGMGFTRRDESEADRRGFDFYVRAGWDPERFGDFFKSMVDKGYDQAPELLSDHPSLASRYQAAQGWARALPDSARQWRRAPVADGAEFRRLQERARAVAARMPDDQTLAQAQKIAAAMPRSCLTPAVHADQKQAEADILRAAERARKERR